MQVKGIITAIKEVQVITDKFKKQEVLLKQEGVDYLYICKNETI